MYFIDSVGNDKIGELSTARSHVVHIDQPIQGSYQVSVIGQANGSYELQVGSYSNDGTPQAAFQGVGSTNTNSVSSYTLTYSPTSPLEVSIEGVQQSEQAAALD